MMKKKKVLTVFMSFVSCFVVFSNSVFAKPRTTSYNPWNNATDQAELFAKQPERYPWCMFTCVKLMLRNIREFAISRDAIRVGINRRRLDAAVGHAVPPDQFEHSMMDRLFESDRARISKTAFAKMRTDLKEALIRVIIDVFNGLIAASPSNELSRFANLTPTELKRAFTAVSDQAVLDLVKETYGVEAHVEQIDQGNLKNRLGEIAESVSGERMVIIGFRDPANHSRAHACVAYGLDGNMLYVYNPWGQRFAMNITKNRLNVSIGYGANGNLKIGISMTTLCLIINSNEGKDVLL